MPKFHKPASPPIDDERIEGMDNIRKYIDPDMTVATFYRRWRKYIDPILIERQDWYRYNRPRYFTFRRYLQALMMKHKKI